MANRREAQPGGIDQDGISRIDRLMDPIDDLAFEIGLVEADGPIAGRLAAHGLDLRERRRAVDGRLPHAEPIEVRAVENKDRSLSHGESPS